VVSATLLIEHDELGHVLKVQRTIYFCPRGAVRLQGQVPVGAEATPLPRPTLQLSGEALPSQRGYHQQVHFPTLA